MVLFSQEIFLIAMTTPKQSAFEEPQEGVESGEEQIIERAHCSSIALPFALQMAMYTAEQRKERQLPEGLNIFSITIGIHTIPFFSSSKNIPPRISMNDARIGFEILDGEPAFAEQKARLFIVKNERRIVLDGEIRVDDWERLRSQCLTDTEVSKIESEMDVAYWKRRAEETKDGILRYGEGESTIKAGAAAELGYAPGGTTGMEDRAVIDHIAKLYGVFDGVGGSDRGEIASTIAAETFHEIMSDTKTKYPSPAWRIRKAFAVADERIRAYRDTVNALISEPEKKIKTPHTTAAVAHIEILPNGLRKAYVASMGDSRVFVCRIDGSTYPLTVDDAYSRDFAMKGDLFRQGHEVNNVISKSIGEHHRRKDFGESFEIREIILQPEEFLVFATDGITDVLATNDRSKLRLSGNIFRGIDKLMKDLFATQSVETIKEFFTERYAPFNPLSKDNVVDKATRKISEKFWTEETTLADAVRSALPNPMPPPEIPKMPVDPQKIADTILGITKEINELRSQNSDLEDRSKTDNRAVVVAM